MYFHELKQNLKNNLYFAKTNIMFFGFRRNVKKRAIWYYVDGILSANQIVMLHIALVNRDISEMLAMKRSDVNLLNVRRMMIVPKKKYVTCTLAESLALHTILVDKMLSVRRNIMHKYAAVNQAIREMLPLVAM